MLESNTSEQVKRSLQQDALLTLGRVLYTNGNR